MGQDRQPPTCSASSEDMLGAHQHIDWLLRAAGARDIFTVRPGQAVAAQRAVRELNNLGGEALAEWIDADIGSGIRLTPRGRRLSVAVGVARDNDARLLAQFGAGLADDLKMLERVRVRTSARNQFLAHIDSLSDGLLFDEVRLHLRSGHYLRVSLTRDSAEALGLQVGSRVVALIKASAIRVVKPGTAIPAGSDLNVMNGRIRTLRRDGLRHETLVEMGSGLTAVSTGPVDEIESFQADDRVQLRFQASAVILGVVA